MSRQIFNSIDEAVNNVNKTPGVQVEVLNNSFREIYQYTDNGGVKLVKWWVDDDNFNYDDVANPGMPQGDFIPFTGTGEKSVEGNFNVAGDVKFENGFNKLTYDGQGFNLRETQYLGGDMALDNKYKFHYGIGYDSGIEFANSEKRIKFDLDLLTGVKHRLYSMIDGEIDYEVKQNLVREGIEQYVGDTYNNTSLNLQSTSGELKREYQDGYASYVNVGSYGGVSIGDNQLNPYLAGQYRSTATRISLGYDLIQIYSENLRNEGSYENDKQYIHMSANEFYLSSTYNKSTCSITFNDGKEIVISGQLRNNADRSILDQYNDNAYAQRGFVKNAITNIGDNPIPKIYVSKTEGANYGKLLSNIYGFTSETFLRTQERILGIGINVDRTARINSDPYLGMTLTYSFNDSSGGLGSGMGGLVGLPLLTYSMKINETGISLTTKDVNIDVGKSEVRIKGIIKGTQDYSQLETYNKNIYAQRSYVDIGHTYTTTEMKTGGKWIDNKEIFRIVVTVGEGNTEADLFTHLGGSSYNTIKSVIKTENVRSRTGDPTNQWIVEYIKN